MQVAAPSFGLRSTVLRHHVSGRHFSALLLVALLVSTFALGILLHVRPPGPPLALTADGKSVGEVAIGSWVWALDVRPGQSISYWPKDAGAVGYDVVVDTSSVGISASDGPESLDVLLIGAIFVTAAMVLVRVGLPGSVPLIALSTVIVVSPVIPSVGLPIGLPAAILPAMAAMSASAYLSRPSSRDMAVLLASVPITLGAILTLAMLTPEMAWPWRLLWVLPGLAALTVAGLIGLSSVARLLRTTRGIAWRRRLALVGADAVPLARHSRIEASAQERAKIATELHNDVLPELGQALLELDENAPAGRARLSRLAQMLRRSMHERQIVVLRQAGLASALQSYIDLMPGPVPIEFDSVRVTQRAPQEIELAAYRIAQAALLNAVDHSGCDSVSISLASTAQNVLLQVVDDGVGIDAVAADYAMAHGHVGLAEMRSLAANVGGDLQIATVPDAGTTVSFRWRG